MIHDFLKVQSSEKIAHTIFLLRLQSAEIASTAKPGQFLNIRIDSGSIQPLLRRPFSISRIEDDTIELLIGIAGQGTAKLSEKKAGDIVDVIGPLGNSFRIESGHTTALLVAGGVGIAPFPFLSHELQNRGKKVAVFAGFRSASFVYTRYLDPVFIATEDGSQGRKGTVIDLLQEYVRMKPAGEAKIFACGPTAMLRALTEFARREAICCEMSLEGDMACGVGLCQGCPVERIDGNPKFALTCKDGPNFFSSDIRL
ncbi:MAG: dihydroorotate dehydrogenase electron transfer subunit [Bacteroidota bacterium]